jgi:ferredoxin-NADP reductase
LESSNALRIRLAEPDSAGLPDFDPGQYLRIKVDIPSVGPAVRAYSLTSHPAEDRSTYEICVGLNAASPGLVSTYLHRDLRVGDLLDVDAPAGIFTLPTRSTVTVVLIATGIGITPFISYLESLIGDPGAPEVTLLYGNRNGQTHAFRHRLEALSSDLSNLAIVNFYSAPDSTEAIGIDFDIRGRLTANDVDADLIQRGARFYLCGSTELVASVSRGLIARSVPKFAIFSEVFRSPVRSQDFGHLSYDVEFRRAGRRERWSPSDGSLLEFAEKCGIKASSGCRVGQCESCSAVLLSGEVQHLHGVEPDDADAVLTCQAIPVSDLALDL